MWKEMESGRNNNIVFPDLSYFSPRHSLSINLGSGLGLYSGTDISREGLKTTEIIKNKRKK